jgi:hypothetical protein
MPSFAHLSTELLCPVCHSFLTDHVWFKWGHCMGYGPKQGLIYHIGDSIRWRQCRDGSIPPWVYFGTSEGNFGDPSVHDVLVRDTSPLFATEPVCEHCKRPLGGAIVEVRNDKIKRAWIYLPGEFSEDVTIYTIEHDGEIKPRPEWADMSMRLIDDC